MHYIDCVCFARLLICLEKLPIFFWKIETFFYFSSVYFRRAWTIATPVVRSAVHSTKSVPAFTIAHRYHILHHFTSTNRLKRRPVFVYRYDRPRPQRICRERPHQTSHHKTNEPSRPILPSTAGFWTLDRILWWRYCQRHLPFIAAKQQYRYLDYQSPFQRFLHKFFSCPLKIRLLLIGHDNLYYKSNN